MSEVKPEDLTDEMIRAFRVEMSDHAWTVICRAALSREIPPRFDTRENARARIAAEINARKVSQYREDEPCPDDECKHVFDSWPANSVTKRDRDYDQCSNCGWIAAAINARKEKP